MKYHKYVNQDVDSEKDVDDFQPAGKDEAFQHLSNAYYSSSSYPSATKKEQSMVVDDMFHAFEKKQNIGSSSPSSLRFSSPLKVQSSPESLLFMVRQTIVIFRFSILFSFC
jgi:hypothetical protein